MIPLTHDGLLKFFDTFSSNEVNAAPPYSRYSPQETAPEDLKQLFKLWKSSNRSGGRIDDLKLPLPFPSCIPEVTLQKAFGQFMGNSLHAPKDGLGEVDEASDLTISALEHSMVSQFGCGSAFESTKIPGLVVLPGLLIPDVQKMLLSKLLHRDLANPDHKTNVHLHYDIQYPEENASFFSLNPETVAFRRKDPAARNIPNREILNKKLRWMTLGGQYNWTEKVYPPGPTPLFPADIAKLITDLLPIMKPEAAIVNLYSPGDTLHMHRDVSEEVDASLISISLGCDAIFVIGIEDKSEKIQSEVLHLRSGDAVIMAGESRFAWHGVPKIIPATCPDYLASWPEKESYPQWDGWMKEKRINLNVRQMQEPRDLVGAEGRHHNNN